MRDDQTDLAGRRLLGIGSDPARGDALYELLGPFFHLIRNRLNSLQMCLYLARRRGPDSGLPPWEGLELPYREVEGLVEQFQSLCKPLAFSALPLPLGLVLDDVSRAWAPRFAIRGAVFQVEADPEAEVGPIDASRWSEGLGGMARWRCDHVAPQTRVTLRWQAARGRSVLAWFEQAEGVAGDRPGGVIDRAGHLPLAVLARVVAAHGGGLVEDHRGGWGVIAEWPTHPGTSPAANPTAERGVP